VWGELRRLDDAEISAARESLTSELGRELIQLMADLSMHRRPHAGAEVRQRAAALGWIAGPNAPIATPIGFKIGDSCREFLMWESRDRRIHEADRLEIMQDRTFENRRIAELGCGFGVNLLSLQGVAKELVGVELEPIYVQLSPIFSALAAREQPKIVEASAAETGLSPGSWDVVLNLGALQYMPIEAVLAETSRLLQSGGTAVMILSHLAGFLRKVSTRMLHLSWRMRAREVVNIAGMLTYPWIGRAFTRPSDPVYPTHRRMERWLDDVGLQLDWSRTAIFGHETCYVAIKR
jgi:SAM-dependent methyltransferase